jgi:hypothetical protein
MSSETRQVRAQDVAGLRAVTYWPRADQTVRELIDELVSQLQLPETEPDGVTPISYSARRDSDGMALSASEKALDVLENNNETVVLEPDVNAG